ncbi:MULTISPECIES: hypothetical protein [Streptomyces]|uniref:hypothetical protein n=1 Tax=Streptomyces TaxID=1883 RepID=UPI001FF303CD|nr:MULTISPECIES: hypothetical protein [unclassified Streptomyces]
MTATPPGSPSRAALRLLPWSSPDGKPCYLAPGDGYSPLSRRADELEALHLTMGAQLLAHAHAFLDGRKVSAEEIRYLANRLTEALRDALRVAESRGGRLRVYEEDGCAEQDDGSTHTT